MPSLRKPYEQYSKIEIGKEGELLAANYLVERDYIIITKNYRALQCEIDIISLQKKTVHFVEVKTRTSLRFGQPESHVSQQKIKRMLNVAAYFLEETPNLQTYNIQLDIIAILLRTNQKAEITFIEDIYA